jgi:hypothetical protein
VERSCEHGNVSSGCVRAGKCVTNVASVTSIFEKKNICFALKVAVK